MLWLTVCQGAAAAEDVEESLAVHFPPIEDHVVLEQMVGDTTGTH